MCDIILTSLFVFGVMIILCTALFVFSALKNTGQIERYIEDDRRITEDKAWKKEKKDTNKEAKQRQAATKRGETEKLISKWRHFAKYGKKTRTRKKYKDRLSVFYIWYLFDLKEASDE